MTGGKFNFLEVDRAEINAKGIDPSLHYKQIN
jgi:hypothetical protein